MAYANFISDLLSVVIVQYTGTNRLFEMDCVIREHTLQIDSIVRCSEVG